MSIQNDALIEIKKRKKEILDYFAHPSIYLPVSNPFTIFMAGSAGAGKTEFSQKFNSDSYISYATKVPIVRIDADEIRKLLPQYNGRNAEEVQAAATNGVEKLFDFVLKKDQNAIVDTTFSDYGKALKNVERSLSHNRKVGIFYIHFDPRIAWAYTKVREKSDGRVVSTEFFIESYFESKNNVNKIKKEFPGI
ncbi:AAA family ATPase [Candidatus Roizmanbacteria bacterium]|nr:AAA family ATPase [Candidatus Roizmanbacteria bacterium]